MLILLLQAGNTANDLTGVGVGTLVALAILDKVLPYFKAKQAQSAPAKSGDKSPEYWELKFSEIMRMGHEEQIKVLGDIRDDIRELVIINRRANGAKGGI